MIQVSRIPFERLNPDSQIVFFTGAGISAESGLATFRDPDGHWAKHDPMQLASRAGFQQDQELVLSWYAQRRKNALRADPNDAHRTITRFQKLFPHSVVITQNVDGLHARAGNQRILELHGNLHRTKCFLCHRPLALPDGAQSVICSCGGAGRPDVVWFGENLDPSLLSEAMEYSRNCDLFFSIGTSNQIFPAGELPYLARKAGAIVIEINPQATPFSPLADQSLREPAGVVLPALYKEFHEAFAA
jgi:NAD-dependent deacetylase